MQNIKFSLEECRRIIAFSDSLVEYHSSTIFKRNLKEFNYFYYTILRNQDTQWVFDKLKLYLDDIYPGNKLDKHPQLYLHKYPVGSRFEIHNDATTHPNQLLNIGVCLNREYEGGDFILYEPEIVLPKIPGTIYHIESYRDHEVLRITEGVRWSLITFLNADDLGIQVKNLI